MFTLRVWDLPTRFFHWVLTLCVLGLFVTAELGGSAMVWHFRFGFSVLTLLLFRLVWGLVGGHWSRWAQLTLHPANVWAYLQGRTRHRWAGHNPLGSWSVLSMLLVFVLQVATGLVSDDEISNVGPLSFLVPGSWVSWSTAWHKDWGQLIVLALVVLHLSSLIWYRFKKNISLVPSMLHGNKTLPDMLTPSLDHTKQRWLAFGVFLLCALLVFLLSSLRP